jgi:chromosome segregation ATPase
MEPEITPEQNSKLETWVAKRDEILSEISSLRTIKEKLEKENKNLADSNTDIETRMNEIRGRIEELKLKESELPTLLRKDIAPLQVTKSNLETDITSLSKIVKLLKEQKESLEKDVAFELETFNSLHGKASILEKFIGHVTEISAKNDRSISKLVEEIKEGMEELVKKKNEANHQTDTVVKELPKVFLEVRRKSI